MEGGLAIGCALNPEAAAVSFHQHAGDEESHPVAMIGFELVKLAAGRAGRLSASMGSARNHHGEAHFVVGAATRKVTSAPSAQFCSAMRSTLMSARSSRTMSAVIRTGPSGSASLTRVVSRERALRARISGSMCSMATGRSSSLSWPERTRDESTNSSIIASRRRAAAITTEAKRCSFSSPAQSELSAEVAR